MSNIEKYQRLNAVYPSFPMEKIEPSIPELSKIEQDPMAEVYQKAEKTNNFVPLIAPKQSVIQTLIKRIKKAFQGFLSPCRAPCHRLAEPKRLPAPIPTPPPLPSISLASPAGETNQATAAKTTQTFNAKAQPKGKSIQSQKKKPLLAKRVSPIGKKLAQRNIKTIPNSDSNRLRPLPPKPQRQPKKRKVVRIAVNPQFPRIPLAQRKLPPLPQLNPPVIASTVDAPISAPKPDLKKKIVQIALPKNRLPFIPLSQRKLPPLPQKKTEAATPPPPPPPLPSSQKRVAQAPRSSEPELVQNDVPKKAANLPKQTELLSEIATFNFKQLKSASEAPAKAQETDKKANEDDSFLKNLILNRRKSFTHSDEEDWDDNDESSFDSEDKKVAVKEVAKETVKEVQKAAAPIKAEAKRRQVVLDLLKKTKAGVKKRTDLLSEIAKFNKDELKQEKRVIVKDSTAMDNFMDHLKEKCARFKESV